MASSSTTTSSTLLLFLFLVFTTTTTTRSDNILSDLIHLRSQSPSGVIRLDDHLLGRILALPHPRPFSFLIFFDAAHLHSNPDLHLTSFKSHFSLISSSFIINDPPNINTLFFFDLEFKDSQRSFALFGVNSLPHIRFINPHVSNLKDSDQMQQGDFSRLAESMAEFIETKGKISIGQIHHPPKFSGKQIAVVLIVLMILAPFVVKKVIAGETLLNDYKFWLFGAIFVYFFSVSGTMHNIIRQMPMFIADRNDPTKVVYFYQGSGMQLGAEGFAVGFLYTIVGVLLGFVTHGLVKLRNVTVQRVMMAFALIVSFWAVKKVVFLNNWKTGYGIHAYWPSSWF